MGTCVALVTSSGRTYASSGSSVGSDHSKIAQLEQEISEQGELVQTLVTRSDAVEGHLQIVHSQIHTEQRLLAADQRSQVGAQRQLQSAAVIAYVDAGSGGTTTIMDTSNASTAGDQQVYLGVESGLLTQAVSTYQADKERTMGAEAILNAEQTNLTASLRQLGTARAAAEAAVERDETILAGVKGNLLALVVKAEQEKEAAAEAAAEAQQAREQKQKAAEAPPPPPPPPPPPVPTKTSGGSPPVIGTGGYADPLRAVSGISPERIDQGVDYSGYGPIYAIGDGTILSTVNGGWPGGTFIAYQLTSGPAQGLVVYAAEDINPDVSVGESVTANTVIGQIYEGPSGIETGWADGSALGESMAASYGQFDGSNSTAFGANFSALLESLGGPGGIMQNDPATGSLPSNWPNW
jgi:murein DD-endopeptidase MepM/ murein hydrolase activator NlpD